MSVTTETKANVIPELTDCLVAYGEALRVSPSVVEVSDRLSILKMRGRVAIEMDNGEELLGEVVSLAPGVARIAPFGTLDGVRRGATVRFLRDQHAIRPSNAFLGRVVNALGEPIDGKGPIVEGRKSFSLNGAPPNAVGRARLGGVADFGVKAMNVFTPTRVGQRLGIFAASGVGKSALIGMIARHSDCDVAVIALIGERGREVREFIEDHLGDVGLARSVVIVATSDEAAMMRREAAFLAMTLCEYFRDNVNNGDARVLCLMDSLTRVALAQREIGLAAGEPPTTKGFPPSVFSLLPAMVERAGPSEDREKPGHVTGVFSVLVEGDDHDEPIADTARSILDGHIVLDRKIAETGRFPAININRSVSRIRATTLDNVDLEAATNVRALSALYDDMREMIRIGAYRAGADAQTDRAIEVFARLEKFLHQPVEQGVGVSESFAGLRELLSD